MKTSNFKKLPMLKEGGENILRNFNEIYGLMSQYYEDMTTDHSTKGDKEKFKTIFYNFNMLKDNFVNFCQNLSESFTEHDLSIKENSTSISEDKLSNPNSKEMFPPKIKSSYDKIYHEFCKVEKVTKEIDSLRQNISIRRQKRIKVLDNKLQEYLDEVKSLNFVELSKNIHHGNINKYCANIVANANIGMIVGGKVGSPQETFKSNENVNKSVETVITIKEENYVNEVDKHKVSVILTNQIVKQILNLNVSKEEDMIDFIESLLDKTNK